MCRNVCQPTPVMLTAVKAGWILRRPGEFLHPADHHDQHLNAVTSQHVGDIQVESPNLQAMAFEPSGAKMYADLADLNKVAVIDREKRTVVATWPTTPECQRPYALALDSAHHRLFVGCRMYAA